MNSYSRFKSWIDRLLAKGPDPRYTSAAEQVNAAYNRSVEVNAAWSALPPLGAPAMVPYPAAATHDERGYAGIRAEASYQDELQRALCDEANGKRRMTAEQSRDLYMIGMMHKVRVDAEGLPQLYIVPIPVLQKDIDDANSDRL